MASGVAEAAPAAQSDIPVVPLRETGRLSAATAVRHPILSDRAHGLTVTVLHCTASLTSAPSGFNRASVKRMPGALDRLGDLYAANNKTSASYLIAIDAWLCLLVH